MSPEVLELCKAADDLLIKLQGPLNEAVPAFARLRKALNQMEAKGYEPESAQG